MSHQLHEDEGWLREEGVSERDGALGKTDSLLDIWVMFNMFFHCFVVGVCCFFFSVKTR